MNRKKVAAVAAVAVSGLVGVGLAVTGTAHAGVNGQQIRVCAPDGDYQQVLLEGINQNGEQKTVSNAFTRGCTPILNFYWVGKVKVTLTQSASGVAPRIRDCDVPQVLLTNNIVECRLNPQPAPGGGGDGGTGRSVF